MQEQQTKGRFTGRHMLAVFVVGFGIVMAVNFYMASLAVGGFHGIVVENSYVASQKFNSWIEEAKADQALGWQVKTERGEDGHVIVRTADVPAGASVSADLRRPLGTREYASLTFVPLGDGTYRSTKAISEGRWTIRLSVTAGEKDWTGESEL